MAQPLSRADIEAAIAKYAPIFQFHPEDQYQPCSVEWFLTHATLVDSQDQKNNIVHPTGAQLPQGPKQGARYYLNIEDSVKPGNPPSAKAYVNAFWQAPLAYTDLQFWFFTAYNGHATAEFSSLVWDKVKHKGQVNLAPLGEHVGDWEYAAVRIDNASKELIGVILSAHGKNILYDKAAIGKQFEIRDGTHPVIYSSLNGHANFPAVGPNYTEHRKILGIPAGLEFNLLNTTATGGTSLKCASAYELVAAEWIKDQVKTPDWVKYPYRWGPEGTVITMDTRTLGEILKASLGAKGADPLLDTPIVLLASELLHIFVKADINGAGAPSGQNPWMGKY
ncbi:hypothetical protein BGZ60DRAFT_434901 [Tricladium varicosporioides]|nr:hypothetical protein BGZ60DRAFT_434901 [Hymenoscyphus varicosporioides]